MSEQTLGQLIEECLKDNMEVSFFNEEDGVTARCRIIGAISMGASQAGPRADIFKSLKAARETLLKNVTKR